MDFEDNSLKDINTSHSNDDSEDLSTLPDSEVIKSNKVVKTHGLEFEIGKLNLAIDGLISIIRKCQARTEVVRIEAPPVPKDEKTGTPEKDKCPLGKEILKARMGINFAKENLREILQNLDI